MEDYYIIFYAGASTATSPTATWHSADGLGIQRQQGYDALNHLVQTIGNYNGTN
jgi:hypothetical protein